MLHFMLALMFIWCLCVDTKVALMTFVKDQRFEVFNNMFSTYVLL